MSIRVIDFLKDKSDLVGKTKFTEAERAVFDAHGHYCHYCRSNQALTIDHIVPRSKGGGDNPENLVPACRTCNSQKRTRSYGEFLEWREVQVLTFEHFGAMADCL